MNADAPPHDHLSDYLSRICDVVLLTAEEEVELARRMEAGTYAAHLIEQGAAAPELEMVAAFDPASRPRPWTDLAVLAAWTLAGTAVLGLRGRIRRRDFGPWSRRRSLTRL
ncbi:sigma-70 factor domain-containing protein [Nonomuraea salmonea]|uniref:Sigma-70 factor domain-containing protein n=2 Tax=Nonomuraea salmonea TaxID=46181 RepID=A0ABV5P3E6_9ACTN